MKYILSRTDAEGVVTFVGQDTSRRRIKWVGDAQAAMTFDTKEEAESSWLCSWFWGTTAMAAPASMLKVAAPRSYSSSFSGFPAMGAC